MAFGVGGARSLRKIFGGMEGLLQSKYYQLIWLYRDIYFNFLKPYQVLNSIILKKAETPNNVKSETRPCQNDKSLNNFI